MRWAGVRDALADLLIGAQCPGCGRPGLGVCPKCRTILTGDVHCRELPTLTVHSACVYAPPVPAIIKTHKDHSGWDLTSVLADALTLALPATLPSSVRLVPVPSAASVVRDRGFDHTWALTRAVARRSGLTAARVMRLAGGGRDQFGLDRDHRFTNRQHRFVARPGELAVVIIDDLVTTGATLIEAERCLTEAGHRVLAAVTVAEAPLRWGRNASPERKADSVTHPR